MRFSVLLAVPVIALTLAGCSAQEPVQKPAATSTEEKPIFASDEEALAAAEAAYANYLQVSDQISRDGGANPERLKGLVTESQFANEVQNYNEYSSSGLHSIGTSTFDSFHVFNSDIQNFSAYLCVDVSETKVLSAQDVEVTPTERINRWPLTVTFAFDSNRNVYIAGTETWTGKNFC